MKKKEIDRRTFLKIAAELPVLKRMRSRLKDFLAAAHDDFLPGPAYGEWYDERRNLIRTGLGPVNG